MRRRRRRALYSTTDDYVLPDNMDGLKPNCIQESRIVSWAKRKISIFESDNIVIELKNKTHTGSRYHHVSIFKEAINANPYKTRYVNRYKKHIAGKF